MEYNTDISFDTVYSITTEFNGKKYKLGSHRFLEKEKLPNNESKIMCHCQNHYGQEWVFVEKFKGLYEIRFNNDETFLNRVGYYLNVKNDNELILSNKSKSLWKLEIIGESEDNKYYIKNVKNNYYLYLNSHDKRDINSFYMDIKNTIDKNDNKKNFIFSLNIFNKKNNILNLLKNEEFNYVE